MSDERTNPLDALREADDKSDLQSALTEFLSIYAEDESQFRVTAFEIVEDKNGSPKPEYIKSWESGHIPQWEEIAHLGAGRYKVQLTYLPKDGEKPTSTSVQVRISKKCVPPVNENLPATVPATGAPVTGDNPLLIFMQMQQNTTAQMMSMMQMFMQTIGGVMLQREKTGSQDLAGVQRMMGDMIMNNVEQQQQLVERILGTKYGIPFGETEESEEPATVFGFLKEMFNKYGDNLLGAGSAMQKMFRKQFQESEDADLIEENPDLYIAAYNDILAGDPQSKPKLDKILEILGAPDPNLLIEGKQPITSPDKAAA